MGVEFWGEMLLNTWTFKLKVAALGLRAPARVLLREVLNLEFSCQYIYLGKPQAFFGQKCQLNHLK